MIQRERDLYLYPVFPSGNILHNYSQYHDQDIDVGAVQTQNISITTAWQGSSPKIITPVVLSKPHSPSSLLPSLTPGHH